MNPELKRIISMFNLAQVEAVEILETVFNCPRPKDQMDFICRCKPWVQKLRYKLNGFKIRPHGIGMAINMGKTKIDFDFGENGEIDAFDAYRLFNFIKANKIESSFKTEEEIQTEISKAVNMGLIRTENSWGNNHFENS